MPFADARATTGDPFVTLRQSVEEFVYPAVRMRSGRDGTIIGVVPPRTVEAFRVPAVRPSFMPEHRQTSGNLGDAVVLTRPAEATRNVVPARNLPMCPIGVLQAIDQCLSVVSHRHTPDNWRYHQSGCTGRSSPDAGWRDGHGSFLPRIRRR